MTAQLEPLFRRDYILAGKAKITLVSKATGARFTYEIRGKQLTADRSVHFVAVLSGPNNGADFRYLGTIFNGADFRLTSNSKVGADAPSFRAFDWAWRHFDSDAFEMWHSGQCGRCRRELTDPASIERGLGPVCAGY